MVGGKVIGLVRRPGHPTMLHVRDTRSTDRVCVDVREVKVDGGDPVNIRLGDSVWWQGGMVLWTPLGSPKGRCRIDYDIALPKVGYTYASSHAIRGEA